MGDTGRKLGRCAYSALGGVCPESYRENVLETGIAPVIGPRVMNLNGNRQFTYIPVRSELGAARITLEVAT